MPSTVGARVGRPWQHSGVTLSIDVRGMSANGLRFGVSPLAELTAVLHALAAPGHHGSQRAEIAAIAARVPATLRVRLDELAALWAGARADFLLPGNPRADLAAELDDLDALDDDTFVTAALTSTCASDKRLQELASALAERDAREEVVRLAHARSGTRGAFAEQLVTDPALVRKHVRRALEDCADAFFSDVWARVRPRLVADARVKSDIWARDGLGAALAAVSPAVRLDVAGSRIVVDKIQDNTTTARVGLTLLPSAFGRPHLLALHAPGWRPVLQYPMASTAEPDAPPVDLVAARLDALAHPVRLRLVRSLAMSPQTTAELADMWDLSAPEVSRHLAVLRRAQLLTATRRGRYVMHELRIEATATLGTDLLGALLR
jgi:DNA-binding transcriptional ArsR family regulator